MKDIHVAFVSFPHHPHVNPTLPIVSVLVRRGYRVTYATSRLFERRVSDTGAEVIRCPGFRVTPRTSSDVDEIGDTNDLSRLALCTLEETWRFYENSPPDLLIYDFMALAGRIAATRLHIPAVQTSPTFALERCNWELQVPNADFRNLIDSYCAAVDCFLETQGIRKGEFLFYREKLNIYLFPRVLQPYSAVGDERLFYAGRCAGEQPYYGDFKSVNTNGLPIVLVGTSTTHLRGPEYFRMCVAALEGLPWHIILSVGDSCDIASLTHLPPNFTVVKNTSHLRILRHASLYICLGGIISTAEAMYHGVPLIVTTHGAWELEWQADNLERLGVGVHLRKEDMNSENLRRTAVEAFQNTILRRTVAQVRQQVCREPGAEESANRIEEYLALSRGSQ